MQNDPRTLCDSASGRLIQYVFARNEEPSCITTVTPTGEALRRVFSVGGVGVRGAHFPVIWSHLPGRCDRARAVSTSPCSRQKYEERPLSRHDISLMSLHQFLFFPVDALPHSLVPWALQFCMGQLQTLRPGSWSGSPGTVLSMDVERKSWGTFSPVRWWWLGGRCPALPEHILASSVPTVELRTLDRVFQKLPDRPLHRNGFKWTILFKNTHD